MTPRAPAGARCRHGSGPRSRADASYRCLLQLADRDLVDAIDLFDADVHALVACGRKVLADVVGPDRQLAVAAVGQDRELHPLRAPVVEERIDRGADGPPGVENV